MNVTTALSIAVAALSEMHGSVTGDPEYDHDVRPDMCKCVYGRSIRKLQDHRKELSTAKRKEKQALYPEAQ